MRLSMWMLYDWLQAYDPQPRITDGSQVLRSARILSQDTAIEKQNVYIANAAEFISGERGKLICVHGQDMILVNSDDMEEVLNTVFDAFDYYINTNIGEAIVFASIRARYLTQNNMIAVGTPCSRSGTATGTFPIWQKGSPNSDTGQSFVLKVDITFNYDGDATITTTYTSTIVNDPFNLIRGMGQTYSRFELSNVIVLEPEESVGSFDPKSI